MQRYIFIILSSILLISCVYRSMYHFKDDDLAWINTYEESDTIIFSSLSEFDTLIVKSIEIYNSYNILSESFNSEYHAIAYLMTKMIHHRDSFDVDIHVQRVSDTFLRTSFVFSDRYRLEAKKELTFEKNGIMGAVGDVIRIDDSNSEMGDYLWSPSKNCEYFYWSKSKGLLKYKYMDSDSVKGKVYAFYKKLPCKPKV